MFSAQRLREEEEREKKKRERGRERLNLDLGALTYAACDSKEASGGRVRGRSHFNHHTAEIAR